MKKYIFYFAFILVFALLTFTSCTKDDKLPTIKITELGYENSGRVVAGEELHIEAEIEAPHKIERVELEIHKEGGYKSVRITSEGNEWHLEMIYDEFKGLKNSEFHKHFDVPITAPAGDYHVHLSVIDQKGNKAKAEAELKVLLPTR